MGAVVYKGTRALWCAVGANSWANFGGAIGRNFGGVGGSAKNFDMSIGEGVDADRRQET